MDSSWEDGALVVRARLPGEVGALVSKAIKAAMAVAEEPDLYANQTQSNVSAEVSATVDEKLDRPIGARRAEAGQLDRHLYRPDDHPRAAWSLMTLNREPDLDIDELTAGSRWTGEPMDSGWATEALCSDDDLAPAP